nr:EAL domain-containing protein [uncultured Rhodoferax sp.]
MPRHVLSRWNVGTRFAAFSLVLMLLVQAAIYVVMRANIDNKVLQQARTDLVTGEAMWQHLLSRNAKLLGQGAEAASHDFSLRSALWTGDADTQSALLAIHGAAANAAVTAVFDSQFVLQATGVERHAQGAFALELQGVAKDFGVSQAAYQLQAIDSKLYQFVLFPVTDTLWSGWILMGMPLESTLADQMLTLSGVHIAVRDSDHKILFSSLSPDSFTALSSMQRSGEVALEHATYMLKISESVETGKGLTTLVMRSMDEVAAPYDKLHRPTLLIVGISLILFAFGSVWLGQGLTVPLRMLAEAAEQFSRGNYAVNLPALQYRDEVGELSRALDHMRNSVQSQQHAIMELAYRDRLTGLPNRTQFRDLIQQSIHVNKAGSDGVHVLTVIMLNLDRFKSVNDALGYAFGDQLLKAVAGRLATQMTQGQATLARLGGDEFGILVEAQDANAAMAIAQGIAIAFEVPLKLDDQTVDLSAGMGLASWPQHALDVDMLLSRAEIAMRLAKQQITGIQIYDPALDSSSAQNLCLLSDLRQALENAELRLYLQPKLTLSDNTVVAAEALLRWQHPVRGSVPPADFIPFAEQTGFVRQLTLWIFEEVAKALPRLHADGRPLRVAINLSTRDLLDHDFPAKLEALMHRHNAAPQDFCLEITESAIMDDPLRAQATLNHLSARGFKLSIDDFGTGYSSLAYLKRLPVNELKIDKSFVMGMENDESDAKIVRSTIDLAHNLGLSVVAEGVENQAILDKLVELQCDEAQGYFMSKPIPLPDFIAWRAKHLATQAT